MFLKYIMQFLILHYAHAATSSRRYFLFSTWESLVYISSPKLIVVLSGKLSLIIKQLSIHSVLSSIVLISLF